MVRSFMDLLNLECWGSVDLRGPRSTWKRKQLSRWGKSQDLEGEKEVLGGRQCLPAERGWWAVSRGACLDLTLQL